MEEKERYIVLSGRQIKDTTNNSQYFLRIETVCKMLNEQAKQIKELEEEKKELEIKLDKCGTELVNAESLVSNLEEVQFDYKKENQQLKQQVEELKGKRLEFYNDEVMQTQVINGVHFDIEQLLVFSEYVEHEKNIRDDKNKQINQLKQQLTITEKALELAVYDKCFAENCIAESFIGKGAKVRFPKKEQWYLEKAKEIMKSE